ncbi:MAG: hypothetical protein HYX47_13205 [Burkholderiales bacterium]|nr:hypothetical protein [Burkholderiales bacterium]
MTERNAAASLVAQRLRVAYERHGLDTSLPTFASEFRSLFGGDEIHHLFEFFNKDADLPLSDVFRLCDAVKVPAAEIFDTGSERDHLQIYDYLGGSMANIFLPPGLMWDRQSVDSLFYFPLGSQVPQGFSLGDFLIFSRRVHIPNPGKVYLVENNQEVSARYCVQGPSAQILGFTRNPEDDTADVIYLDRDALAGDESNGFASVTGALLWRITASQSPEAVKPPTA